jgi:hypothetical protein
MKYLLASPFALIVLLSAAPVHAYTKCPAPTDGAAIIRPRLAAGGGPIDQTRPFLGTTAPQIAANFVLFVEQSARMRDFVADFSDTELANLAALYDHASGDSNRLVQIFAGNLKADELARVAAAFGQARTAALVHQWAPAPVALAFDSHPILQPFAVNAELASEIQTARIAGATLAPAGTLPNPGMTLGEIYGTFRAAGSGVGAALVQSAVYDGFFLYTIAFQAGYTTGGYFNAFMEANYPGVLGNWTSAIVDWVNGLNVQLVPLQNGANENAINTIFGNNPNVAPAVPFGSAGDWNTMIDFQDFIDMGC